MRLMAKIRRRVGFTLVELLVVIGIIALLIAILLPVLGKARSSAQRTACMSNVRQLWMAINLYCNANNDWYPTVGYWDDGTAYVQYPEDWIHWQSNRQLDDSPVAKYLNIAGDALKRVLRCPSDMVDGRKPRPGISAGQGAYLYSYAMNQSVAENDKNVPFVRTKRVQWRRAAEKILITEPNLPTCPVWSPVAPLIRRHGEATSKITAARMGSNVSAAFMDGHVQGVDEDLSIDIKQAQPDQ
jgi:prepilin-type N-terminal cleavage/methylation domain-containing protein